MTTIYKLPATFAQENVVQEIKVITSISKIDKVDVLGNDVIRIDSSGVAALVHLSTLDNINLLKFSPQIKRLCQLYQIKFTNHDVN